MNETKLTREELVRRAEHIRYAIQQAKLRIKEEQRNINEWNDELKELDKEFKALGGRHVNNA